jgi:hypothetical protein
VKASNGYPAGTIEVLSYWFLHAGRAYNATCVSPVEKLGTYVPICTRIASSLRNRPIG